jgi:hypothetical protein
LHEHFTDEKYIKGTYPKDYVRDESEADYHGIDYMKSKGYSQEDVNTAVNTFFDASVAYFEQAYGSGSSNQLAMEERRENVLEYITESFESHHLRFKYSER